MASWDNAGSSTAVTLVSGSFKCSSSTAASVFADVLVIESKVRPRVRLILMDVLLVFNATAAGTDVDPFIIVNATVVLVLGLEVARGSSRPEPGSEPGLLWTSPFGPAGLEPRALPGSDPGLLLAGLGVGDSIKEGDKSARADFELDRTGPGLEESEPALTSGLGLALKLAKLGLLSLDPDRQVPETDPTRSILEPDATREGLEEEERVEPGLDLEKTLELELGFNAEPCLKLGLVLRFELALESEV